MTSIRKTKQEDLFDRLYAQISGQVTEEVSVSKSSQNHASEDNSDTQASRQPNHAKESAVE
ncbi:hypothetical protein B1757_13075 [Acidithiobacillus marinus]|uniref:Uncharacterized protein n=1 Tax=Acidithiobacillus marinus TaxID=187490 RepID=A0A2I1DIV9_9PROT|nr:hypothetical protein [Acidithiobacillus marinus]PKY09814.1 hypothetical protein B1757_13075 [Acidithiobacillus marinus]